MCGWYCKINGIEIRKIVIFEAIAGPFFKNYLCNIERTNKPINQSINQEIRGKEAQQLGRVTN